MDGENGVGIERKSMLKMREEVGFGWLFIKKGIKGSKPVGSDSLQPLFLETWTLDFLKLLFF